MKTDARKWAWASLLQKASEEGVRIELPIVVWKERSWGSLLLLAVIAASALALGAGWK